jgi:hypothetical protein
MDRRYVCIESVRSITDQSIHRSIDQSVITCRMFKHDFDFYRVRKYLLVLATVFQCSPDLPLCFYQH